MKTFTIELEFENGEFDLRQERAETEFEAEQKALSKNNAMVGKRMFPSAKIAVSAKAQ